MNKIIDLRELTDEHLNRVIVKMAKEGNQKILNILLKEKTLRINHPNINSLESYKLKK